MRVGRHSPGAKPAIEAAMRSLREGLAPEPAVSQAEFRVLLTRALDRYHAEPHAGIGNDPIATFKRAFFDTSTED